MLDQIEHDSLNGQMLSRKFVSYLTDPANAFFPEGRVGGGREKL